jgi:hypothetical protein
MFALGDEIAEAWTKSATGECKKSAPDLPTSPWRYRKVGKHVDPSTLVRVTD